MADFSNHNNSPAFWQGVRKGTAFKRGDPIPDNPYKPLTNAFYDWSEGWDIGFDNRNKPQWTCTFQVVVPMFGDNQREAWDTVSELIPFATEVVFQGVERDQASG